MNGIEILFLIIIGAPVVGSAAGYLTQSKSPWPHIAGAAVSLAGVLWMMYSFAGSSGIHLRLTGFPENSFLLHATVEMAWVSLVVALVAMAIFIYAKGYMAHEKGKTWFWCAISLFLAAMQLLVFAGDWFLLITGWEIMGFASFLLIATWHERAESRKGAMNAFLQTRFADLGLYVGAFIVILQYESTAIPWDGDQTISLFASMGLLLAAMGKSAQLPFQSWLAGAMAGPTPVSALLHSATMVGAGALLLIKLYPVFPETALFYIAIIGSITILFTGFSALLSKDIKKMLAASTSSQYGFMFLALGLGFPGAAFAHWLAHAFMKSSLFLGAGVFQHTYGGTSYSTIKGTGKHLKIVYASFALAGISLAGIPPMVGYWSKDALLAASFMSQELFFMGVVLAGAFFTAAYIAKALHRLWVGQAEKKSYGQKLFLLSGITVLSLIIIGGGFFLEEVVTLAGYEFPKDKVSKFIGLVVAVLGLISGWFYSESWMPTKLKSMANDHYAIAGGYEALIAKPLLALASRTYTFDRWMLSGITWLGSTILAFSSGAYWSDRNIRTGMMMTANATMRISAWSKFLDQYLLKGVNFIGKIVKKGGAHGRMWQSGLVHRELAITTISLLILLFILTFSFFTL